MPELPEVETIVSDLNKILPGLIIRDFWCNAKNIIKQPKSFNKFKNDITGKKILKISRRGKNILIEISDSLIILVHQKMTGHLLFGKYQTVSQKSKIKSPKLKNNIIWETAEAGPLRDDPYNRFIHMVLTLSNEKHLVLSDVRKFAKVMLINKNDLENFPDLKNLGPEPLEKDFTLKEFQKILGKTGKNKKIKQFLMEQKNIVGIGNIYADEILWQAGVNPLRNSGDLNEKDIENIFNAIKEVLKTAIKAGGDSMSDYRRPSGEKGNYQNMQNAYRQTGKLCKKNDGGIIKRIKLGQRSTHFCPVHQK